MSRAIVVLARAASGLAALAGLAALPPLLSHAPGAWPWASVLAAASGTAAAVAAAAAARAASAAAASGDAPRKAGPDAPRAILEEKVAERTRELQRAYDRLKKVDEMKDAFLSSVSHELRTPLSSIRSFSEILLNHDEDSSTRREFLGIIKQESERLTRLIEDLLDIARIEAGQVRWNLEAVSLQDLSARVIESVSVLAREKGQTVCADVPADLPLLRADADRLSQVLNNLLANAIKFTPQGGRIVVRAAGAQASGSAPAMATVSVEDDGPGIPAEALGAIFEKFIQGGDPLTGKPRGSGLGLPISREIVRNLGGTIWAESGPGGGCALRFTLPLASSVEEPAVAWAARGEAGALRVAVADDDPHLVELLSIALRQRGYAVLAAHDGDQALDLAAAGGLDLLILDLNMPRRSGWEVLKRLHANEATRGLPVIVLTGVRVEMDRARALALGALEYLEKGPGLDRLISEIDLFLESRGASAAGRRRPVEGRSGARETAP